MRPRNRSASPTGQFIGTGSRMSCLLDLVEQFERITTRAIPLVDEGDDRNLPIAADLEQFAGLGFDALRTVEHHDRGVGCREHAVGVLGEVAVALACRAG